MIKRHERKYLKDHIRKHRSCGGAVLEKTEAGFLLKYNCDTKTLLTGRHQTIPRQDLGWQHIYAYLP